MAEERRKTKTRIHSPRFTRSTFIAKAAPPRLSDASEISKVSYQIPLSDSNKSLFKQSIAS